RRWDRSCSFMYLLPAGLGHARHFTTHSHFTQLVASQTELAENAARATGDHAAVALTGRVGIARQLLQRQASLVAFFVGLRLVVDDGLECRALCSVLLGQLGPLDIAIDEGKFCHVIAP